ncbi:MAG: adenylate/guanylate cyclase domain-containing protein [Thermodesulfobacteriota bacterium]|nr:MAG: adenylate/guanylate cyclase domain-containing protein [Thermodesulfobacteriota bacterium]
MSRLSKSLIVGLLIGTLGVAATLVPCGLDLEESIGLDLLFKMRGVREVPSEVVVVTVDKVSADKLNLPIRPDKWPRSLHARLIENMVRKGTAVIAFDMTFDQPRSPEHDNLFAGAIKNAGNVVLCEHLKKETIPLTDAKGTHTGDLDIERLVPPIPSLAESAVALAPFPLPKIPVKLSQYWMFKTGAGDTPTLPVVVFQIFALDVYDEFIHLLGRVSPSQADRLPQDKDLIISSKGVENLIRVLRDIFKKDPLIAEKMLDELQNSNSLSVDIKRRQVLKSLIRMYQGDISRYLNFYGPPCTVTTISYYQLLQSGNNSTEYQEQHDLDGKAVFAGLSRRLWPEQKDGFHTVFSQASGLDISGVEIAASAFANLLEDMSVQPLDFRAHLAFIFVWGVVLGIVCLFLPAAIAAFSVIGLSLLYLAAAHYQFKYTGIWYPLVIPLFFQAPAAYFGTVLWKYFEVNKERQNIRKAFGYYLPDKVVDRLVKNMAYIKASSHMVYGTCLFTDAGNYTTLSENMEPKELSSFMNKYWEALFEPVKLHKGVVSDVVGDSMLAIWATAQPDSSLRTEACLTALDIAGAAQKFNESHDNLKLPTRIGLHSGYMLLGNIGAINHYEYTPIGDIVNTASRVEGLNKYLSTRMLVSKEVLYQVDGFLTRELGKFLLVGKSKPVVVYELICLIGESSEQQRRLCKIFNTAMNAFRRQSWDEAIKGFNESMEIHCKDGPSIFYLKLCEKYKENPPGETWDGLVSLDRK